MQGNNVVKSITKNIALYAIWLVFTASQVGLLLWIHELIVAIALLSAKNAWVPRAVDMWSMVILGMFALAAIFVTEGYLANGVKIHRFWYRVGVVALIEGILALVLLAIDTLFL